MTPVPVSRADESAAARPGRSGDVAPPTVTGHDAAPGTEEQQVLRTMSAEASLPGDASGRREQRAHGPRVVGPSLTPAGRSPADQSFQEPSPVDIGVPFRKPEPAGDASRRLASAVPPAADPQGLPRLHAVRTSEPAAAKPEITVTIGRIEVLQPAPEPPAPGPAPPVKGATAPDLAEYLRDRSGR